MIRSPSSSKDKKVGILVRQSLGIDKDFFKSWIWSLVGQHVLLLGWQYSLAFVVTQSKNKILIEKKSKSIFLLRFCLGLKVIFLLSFLQKSSRTNTSRARFKSFTISAYFLYMYIRLDSKTYIMESQLYFNKKVIPKVFA